MSEEAAPSLRRQVWRWSSRALGAVLVLALAGVLAHQAGRIDWSAVGRALAEMPAHLLLAAALMALVSHLLYGCFDLLGRRYTGHPLPIGLVLLIGTTSYAFNLSLGAILGGMACRARLYTRLGLHAGRIARIVTFSLVSNWLGYLLLAGAVFALVPPELPPAWGMQDLAGGRLRWLGAALLALGLSYLGLCARHGGHALGWRQQAWPVPHLPLALAQMAVSVAHWATMAAVLFLLLQGRVPYVQVLAVLLLAAAAGVLTHVPAGLGVLEAVFVALLSHRLPAALILAALVGYRVLFYLLPLGLGAGVFLRLEAQPAR